MKYLFLSLAFGLCAIAPVFSQNTTAQNEEAIKKVCAAETQAWLDQDVEAWAATHLQSDKDLLNWNNSDGSCDQMKGWKNIETAIREAAKTGKKSTDKLANDQFQFTFSGDMAFVSYEQSMTNAEGKIQKSHENRVMISTPKGWKIQAVMAFWDYKK